MTDEQLEKAIMCWTGTTVSEKECMACPYNDKCTLEEIANEIIHRWRECKTENATLRERLEKSVELPKPFIEQSKYSGLWCVFKSKIEISCGLSDMFDTREAAEVRLAELKGEER